MVSAAIATAPANLKISLVRTPYFIRPDLGREPSGELWSDMLRCHAAKKQKDRDRDRERIEAAAAGPPALANDLALADGAAPANSLQAHATQSDVDAGLERWKAYSASVGPASHYDFGARATSAVAVPPRVQPRPGLPSPYGGSRTRW